MSADSDLVHFEDCPPGAVSEYGDYQVTKQEIVDFASKYDPQPVHLDDEAAKAHMLGGLCASGWHTCSMLMRMNCDGFLLRAASMGGPGIAEVKWLKPVRPGDTLCVRQEVVGARTSKTRPDTGLLDCVDEVLDQSGALVMTRRSIVLLRRRHPDPFPVAAREKAATPTDGNAAPASASDAEADGGIARYLDDIVVGSRRAIGTHTFTKDDIVQFARRWDPQPFHLDEEAARRSHYGALIASGWHTAGCWMGSFIRHYQREVEELTARGVDVPPAGPSPGFRDLRWPKPTYVGDTLSFASQVIDKRVAATRPGWGLVFSRNIALNQRGEVVYEFVSSAFWPRKVRN